MCLLFYVISFRIKNIRHLAAPDILEKKGCYRLLIFVQYQFIR